MPSPATLSSLPIKSPKPIASIHTQKFPKRKFSFLPSFPQPTSKSMVFLETPVMRFRRSSFQKSRSTLNTPNSEKDPVLEGEADVKEGRDWTTSIFLFVLWGALLYNVFNLAPNQTPLQFSKQNSCLAIPDTSMLWWHICSSPPVEDRELKQWPLNFLDSKLTAGISLAAGVSLFLLFWFRD